MDFTHTKVFDKGFQSHFVLYKKSYPRAEKFNIFVKLEQNS